MIAEHRRDGSVWGRVFDPPAYHCCAERHPNSVIPTEAGANATAQWRTLRLQAAALPP